MTRTDQVNRTVQFIIVPVVIHRPVTAGLQCRDFLDGQAEEKKIIRADFLPDFNIGAIQGPDGEGPVHGKFHIAGSRSLLSGQGNLFGQVGHGIDRMTGLDIVIGKKKNF